MTGATRSRGRGRPVPSVSMLGGYAFSERATAYFRSHAIDAAVAAEAGVCCRGDSLVLPYISPDGERFERIRDLGGRRAKVLQPAGRPLCLWWPMGRPT